MPARIWTCKVCNHRNKFGRSYSSYCHMSAPYWNNISFVALLLLGLIAGAAYIST